MCGDRRWHAANDCARDGRIIPFGFLPLMTPHCAIQFSPSRPSRTTPVEREWNLHEVETIDGVSRHLDDAGVTSRGKAIGVEARRVVGKLRAPRVTGPRLTAPGAASHRLREGMHHVSGLYAEHCRARGRALVPVTAAR